MAPCTHPGMTSFFCLKVKNGLITRNWKTSAVSTTDGWLKLNFASCVLRQTCSLGALVLCSICSIRYGICELHLYDMVVDTQFHKFYGRPFARVLYLFLMKDIGRWLPWVLPGSTGRFHRDDFGLEPFCALALYNPCLLYTSPSPRD